MYTIRQYLGALLRDVPRAIKTAGRSDQQQDRIPWVHMHNRDQSLISAPNGAGVKCDWEWTSDLYLPKVIPAYGRWLYRRVLQDFPISFKYRPEPELMEKPQVSFIIGHRGKERLPLLLATLKSIAAQKGCRFECIVVEQDNQQLVKNHLPRWVRYIHTPLPEKKMPYSRSWAFNVGSKMAKSDFLVFHDNDILVPIVYANDLLKFYREGCEVINLKRYIFYFNKDSTQFICEKENTDISPGIEAIMQNAEGGGSIGISRQAYFDIGGFDERFVGWGGEDNEFWDRTQTKTVFDYGYLPLIHLWHKSQPEKTMRQSQGVDLYKNRMSTPALNRINRLRQLNTFDDTL